MNLNKIKKALYALLAVLVFSLVYEIFKEDNSQSEQVLQATYLDVDSFLATNPLVVDTFPLTNPY